MPTWLPDVIDPIDGWWGRMQHGPMHRFTFKASAGCRGVDVEYLMRQYGIRIWGREVTNDAERAFLVKRSQAVWAEYILCRAGVPLTCDLLDPSNADYRTRHPPHTMPKPWDVRGIGPQSFVDHVVDWLARIGG